MLLASTDTGQQLWAEHESDAIEEKHAQESRRQQEENDTRLLLAQFPPSISPEQQHTVTNVFLHDAATKEVHLLLLSPSQPSSLPSLLQACALCGRLCTLDKVKWHTVAEFTRVKGFWCASWPVGTAP